MLLAFAHLLPVNKVDSLSSAIAAPKKASVKFLNLVTGVPRDFHSLHKVIRHSPSDSLYQGCSTSKGKVFGFPSRKSLSHFVKDILKLVFRNSIVENRHYKKFAFLRRHNAVANTQNAVSKAFLRRQLAFSDDKRGVATKGVAKGF